ncbi:MAG TPA: type I DNA topoisomerase, partial [Nitrospiria bacterium]|nr:type I DNA topoisomerase [Nitrospiria bacterium]
RAGQDAPPPSKGRSLLIVESPSKAKTLSKYLGRQFMVKTSVGHIKDLPKSKLGIDVKHEFKPEYVVIQGKQKVVDEIKAAAAQAVRIYLAPDPDREGEAIAWHIAEELNGRRPELYRVLIHEITERAVRDAIANPGRIDMHKVQAQQARRVLDRIVGYTVSPLLWEKVRRGLSAGRVQSVAVRLICEREKEITAFVKEEFWSVTATVQGANPPPFAAKLARLNGEPINLTTQAQAEEAAALIRGAELTVASVEQKEKRRNPLPPFTTSKLQQEAVRKLRFTAKKTMTIAQRLYEGIELGKEGPVGLITYMRTDSTRISNEALAEARRYIEAEHGAAYLPERPNVYKNKKGAQDAHEAIRPTAVDRHPDQLQSVLERDAYMLYKLIWQRFVASQMTQAQYDVTRAEITAQAAQGRALLTATGTVMKFPGFTTLYTEAKEEAPAGAVSRPGSPAAETEEADRTEGGMALPPLQQGDRLRLLGVEPKQHFTQPPPRYNEALLVKELEELGIGRPSTYATIISTIQERKYVDKIEGRFHPTELGLIVNELLITHFPDIFTVRFTAKMEEELDEIEEGQLRWVQVMEDFYKPFEKRLSKAQVEMQDVKRREIPTEHQCDKCGKPMIIKWGRHGSFLACSGYPDCRNTKEFVKEAGGAIKIVERAAETTGEQCPQCGSPMIVKRGRFGRFLACSRYPDCKTTQSMTTGVACPQEGCDGKLVEKQSRRGKRFYACSRYPKCTFALWDRPVARPCPQCRAPFLVEKFTKSRGAEVVCRQPDCGYKEEPVQQQETAV